MRTKPRQSPKPTSMRRTAVPSEIHAPQPDPICVHKFPQSSFTTCREHVSREVHVIESLLKSQAAQSDVDRIAEHSGDPSHITSTEVCAKCLIPVFAALTNCIVAAMIPIPIPVQIAPASTISHNYLQAHGHNGPKIMK